MKENQNKTGMRKCKELKFGNLGKLKYLHGIIPSVGDDSQLKCNHRRCFFFNKISFAGALGND